MEKTFKHIPVMLNECIESLNIKPTGIYVDCTLGGGGHSSEILKKLTTGRLIGFDKDLDAINNAKELFKDNKNLELVSADYKDIENVLDELNIEKVDGIIMDLGVSSYQLDTADRGFSFRFNSKLDMRMDQSQLISAYEVVNSYSAEKLTKILYEYGEEPFAKKIVNEIVRNRTIKPIETTWELADIVQNSYPIKVRKERNKNCATKTFQAIRIEVNGELINLENTIRDGVEKLSSRGRMVILTFHSLEDRITKNVFKELSTDCICDKRLPVCTCNHKASILLVNKKPIIASKNEIENNPRSTSAKLRVIEKI